MSFDWNKFGFAAVLPALLLSTASASAHPNHPPVPVFEVTTEFTWSEDIRPIFERKCMVCHSPSGTVAPYFDLSTYSGNESTSGAADWSYGAAEEVLTRRMPPWGADPRYGAFANDRSLSQQEIDAIVDWAHGGRPEGAKKNLPTPAEFTTRNWTVGEPDFVFAIPAPQGFPDEEAYPEFAFTFPVEFEGDAKWISGVEFLPSLPGSVHSIVVFIRDSKDAAAYSIDMKKYIDLDAVAESNRLTEVVTGTIPAGTNFLAQWSRGEGPVVFPEGVGKLLRAGSALELIIRYDTIAAAALGEGSAEQSKFGVYVADANVKRIGQSLALANDNFVVPAGEADYEARAEYTLDEDVYLYGIYPHFGRTATDIEILAHYPDGRSTTMLLVPEFKYAFNQSYLLAEPLLAPKGTRLEVVGHYDNSAENWSNPHNPPRDLAAPADEQLRVYIDHFSTNWIYVPEESDESEPDAPALQ